MSVNPHAVQRALVCMLFDPKYAARVRGPEPIAELDEAERALLREVDPRALGTDDMRRARAMHALLDEYPVSAAVLGLDGVDRFFATEAFRECVFGRGSMALCFGQRYLRDRARGVGAIETAMAAARRAVAAGSGPAQGQLACRRGIVALVVPAKSLAWYQSVRGRLGAEPLQALARRRKPWPQKPPRRGREHLLVEAKVDASIELGTGSPALVELLIAAATPRPRAELAGVAIELGAEPGEVEEIFDDLLAQDLLTRL